MSRCLYNSNFKNFMNTEDNTIFGILCERYHGEALTTTREAWKSEISITRLPEFYDGTYQYLKSLGIEEI